MEYQIFLMKIVLPWMLLVLLNRSDSNAELSHAWSEWQSCTKSCNSGFQFRARDSCPSDKPTNCSLIDHRRCNEFACDKIPTTTLTTKSSTPTIHISTDVRGESLMSSSFASPTTQPDVPEVTTELMTTLLTKPTPKIVRSTKTRTTTTTTSSTKLVANPRSGAVCLRSSLLVIEVLIWNLVIF